MKKYAVPLALFALILALANVPLLAQTVTVPMKTGSWLFYALGPDPGMLSPAPGLFESTSKGLKFYGREYRDALGIATKDIFDVRKKTIYFRWKAHGGGTFMAASPLLVDESLYLPDVGKYAAENPQTPFWHLAGTVPVTFTTCWSYNGSILIADDVWYYTRATISGETLKVTTTTEGYNGPTFSTYQRPIPSSMYRMRIGIIGFDMYASTSANVTLGEVIVEPNSKRMISELISTVYLLNLQNGIANSLDAKLGTALAAMDALYLQNDQSATGPLNAFINEVNAQRGKKISTTDADMLISKTQEIILAIESQ
jgi:hypothetical protein